MKKKPRYTLGKNARLKSRKAIEQIFAAGQGFSVFPFRVTWMLTTEQGGRNDEQGMKNREQGIPNEELPSGQLPTVNHQQKDGRWRMADGGKTDNVNEEGNANKEMPSCQPPTVNHQQKDGRWQKTDGGRTDNVNEQGNTNKEMPSCQPPTAIRQPLQIAFSVPRRQFKKAVHRNRIKRLMREAWRLQKNPLQEILLTKGIQLRVFLIYTGRDLPPWALVQEKIIQVIKRLQKTVHEKPADHS